MRSSTFHPETTSCESSQTLLIGVLADYDSSASLEVDTTDWRKPILVLEAIIDGKSAYKFEFVGQPVSLSFTSSLSVNLGGALKGVLNKIGLGRTLF